MWAYAVIETLLYFIKSSQRVVMFKKKTDGIVKS